MTKVNKPRVRILMGKVKITSIGLTIALKMPKTSATVKAVWKVSTLKPGMYWEIKKMVKADRSQLAKIEKGFTKIL